MSLFVGFLGQKIDPRTKSKDKKGRKSRHQTPSISEPRLLSFTALGKRETQKGEMGHDQEEEETPPAAPTTTASAARKDQEEETWNHQKQTLILELSEKLITGDLQAKIEAARDIRKVVRKSSVKTRSKFAAAGVIQPLVFMLLSPDLDAREASLLALLNLAVRNERSLILFIFFFFFSLFKHRSMFGFILKFQLFDGFWFLSAIYCCSCIEVNGEV